MLDHLTIGSHDFDASTAFYTACFSALGIALQKKDEQQAAFGKGEQWRFFVYPAAVGTVLIGERMHVAFSAESAAAVHAFYDTALSLGATPLRPPGGNPNVNERYFGAMCKDLDQHTLEVVYWDKAGA